MAKRERINILKNKLNNDSFYKLDCVFDNFEKHKIISIIYIYVLAGFSAIDVRADIDSVIQAKETIIKAMNYAIKMEETILEEPFLIISCYSSELKYKDLDEFENFLRLSKKKGVDFFELHVDTADLDLIKDKLLLVKKVFNFKPISINISRDKFSNANIVELIKYFRANIQKDLIIEVDGSEEKNNHDFNTTLQSVSTADILHKQLLKKEIAFRKIPILLSGGTNSLTCELAKECNVHFNGITFNDYAKVDFERFVKSHSFDNDLEIKNYVKEIKKLIM